MSELQIVACTRKEKKKAVEKENNGGGGVIHRLLCQVKDIKTC